MTTEQTDFKTQVNSIVDSMTQGADGNWVIPEEVAAKVGEEVLYAAKIEKRFRDTQSAFTKVSQKAKSLETVNSQLTQHMIDNATLHLNEEERAELNALRSTDPEAWRIKITEAENKAKNIIRERISTFEQEGKKLTELEIRQQKVEAFKERTGIELNNEFIESNLPARYIKDLEAGTIDFDEFLKRSEDYLTKAKVIKGANEEVEGDKTIPDLATARGGSQPAKQAQEVDSSIAYKNEIY
jgi:hypothetical protein